jgi:outer membrane assembly lipoprotein YfiO
LVRQHVEHGQYRSAVSAANRFLKLYDDPAGREEVMMLAGQAEVKRGRLFQGYEWFEKLLAEYPQGRFANQALEREFDVAEAFLAGKKRIVLGFLRLPARDEGLDILSRIAEHVPGSALAERALMRIADDRYGRREWIDAADAYDRYLASFPQGAKAGEAMLKAAEATHRSFAGVAHDETPLIEAEQRYRQLAGQYPVSAAEVGVEATVEQIRAARADKMLEEGRFYERINKPQAAAFSYRRVIDTYPQTDAAEQARAALERLAPKLPPPREGAISATPSAAPEPPKGTPPVAASAPAPAAPTRSAELATSQPDRTSEETEIIDLERFPATTAPSPEGQGQ